MPSSLRRNSFVSFLSTSSREGSRRNSIDERRFSFSSKRSQSTQASSTEDTRTSSGPPRLPSFRWRSRSSSKVGTDYEKDFLAFAYKLESSLADRSGTTTREASRDRSNMRQVDVTQNTQSDTRSSSKGPPIKAKSQTGSPLGTASRGQSVEQLDRDAQNSISNGQHKPGDSQITDLKVPPLKPRHKRTDSPSVSRDSLHDKYVQATPPKERPVQANSKQKRYPISPSHDGSSYVHKQRMYQQQMSIAGFHDQQAVQLANEAPVSEVESVKNDQDSERGRLLGFRRRARANEDENLKLPRIPFGNRRDSTGSSTSPSRSRTRLEDERSPLSTIEANARNGLGLNPPSPLNSAHPSPRLKLDRVTTPSPKSETRSTRQEPANSLPRPVMAKASTEPVLSSATPPSVHPQSKSTPSPDMIRNSSITRPRSNPQLQTNPTTAPPNLDFLPQLKHQPFTKSPRRQSSPAPSAKPPDLALMPKSPLRSSPPMSPSRHPPSPLASTTTLDPSPGKSSPTGLDAKPIAKMFVICCQCNFWHDLPSKLYEAMALPVSVSGRGGSSVKGAAAGRLDTAIKCPWCQHGMTTSCCEGWTGVVYLHRQHH